MNHRDSHPIQTLHLNDKDKAKLLLAMEESATATAGQDNRRLRVPWMRHDVTLTLISDTGTLLQLAVMGRNLGRWGAALVHGRYVYPETRCELHLCALDGGWHARAGVIRHVRHVQGLVHELGVNFDSPIDLSNFVPLTPEQETRHLKELADDLPKDDGGLVTQLVSRVLVVDDFASDRKLYGHWLGRAGMAVTTVGDGKGAQDRLNETQFDLMIVDLRLGKESGLDLIRLARSSSFVAPILVVTADNDANIKASAIAAGANGLLVKPFTAEELVETAHQLMGMSVDRVKEPIYSACNNDPEMRPLLTEFTRGLGAHMDRLREANARHDYETLDAIAWMLKGAGKGYGFDEITDKAAAVLYELNEGAADMERIRQSANELLSVLNRVKMR